MWNAEKLKKRLKGHSIGDPLYYYDEIGSTNDEVFRLGQEGAPEGTVCIADRQSGGRGRMQRVWHSPPGANIYTSILLRPSFDPVRAGQISIAAGVAVAETLNPVCGGKAALKWPNDVQIGGKKVCGILAQMKITDGTIDFIVVGIGINVNMSINKIPNEINHIATSLFLLTGREMSRQDLIIRLYENIAKWYRELTRTGFEPVKEKWLGLSPMIGQTVSVSFGKEEASGKALGLDDDGSLLLQTAAKTILRVSAGDATILKR